MVTLASPLMDVEGEDTVAELPPDVPTMFFACMLMSLPFTPTPFPFAMARLSLSPEVHTILDSPVIFTSFAEMVTFSSSIVMEDFPLDKVTVLADNMVMASVPSIVMRFFPVLSAINMLPELSSSLIVLPLFVVILLVLFPSPPPFPVLPLNRLPMM